MFSLDEQLIYLTMFSLNEHLIYLNHAGVAPLPHPTAEAIQYFAQESMEFGAKYYPEWEKTETELRGQLKTLLNAPSVNDIALLKSTSEALSVVAHGLTWQTGDNVIITNLEFPSNRVVWESLQPQGVEVRQAKVYETDTPEDALFALVDEKTRLISVSSVQYACGLRMDLQKIGEFCQKHNILFCVDAIQSLGALQMDVQTIHVDFLMADGHKWLLGPEGLAVFYCKEDKRELLQLHQFGWHMVEDYKNYNTTEWQIAKTARRFECGSPNMLGVYGLNASVKLLLKQGLPEVERKVLSNTAFLLQQFNAHDSIEVLSEQRAYAGIVVFRPVQADTNALFKHLFQQDIICAPRGGGIRFSPHFYTPRNQLEKAVEVVLNFCENHVS